MTSRYKKKTFIELSDCTETIETFDAYYVKFLENDLKLVYISFIIIKIILN